MIDSFWYGFMIGTASTIGLLAIAALFVFIVSTTAQKDKKVVGGDIRPGRDL